MDGVSNNFALTPFYYLPQEVTLQIVEKLRPFPLIQFTGTCKTFYNLREHGWEWLCKQDFRWLCSPSMKITSNPDTTWRGLYQAMAQDTQNILWTQSSVVLNNNGRESVLVKSLNAQGHVVIFSLLWKTDDAQEAEQGFIQTWSLDGKYSSFISIPSAILKQIEHFSHSAGRKYFPKSEVFLFQPYKTNPRKGYLYWDAKLYPIENMTWKDHFHEIGKNIFVHYQPNSCLIQVLRIDSTNTMNKEQLTTQFTNIVELVPLTGDRFLIHNNKLVCIYSFSAQGWSQTNGSFDTFMKIKSLPNGMIVLSRQSKNTVEYSLLTLDTLNDRIDVTLVKKISSPMKYYFVADEMKQLPNGNIVNFDNKEQKIQIWSRMPTIQEKKSIDCIGKLQLTQLFVHPDTGQIIVLAAISEENPRCIWLVFSPSIDLSISNDKSS